MNFKLRVLQKKQFDPTSAKWFTKFTRSNKKLLAVKAKCGCCELQVVAKFIVRDILKIKIQSVLLNQLTVYLSLFQF